MEKTVLVDEEFNPYDTAVEVPRRTMVLFFVVDTSGSMSGSKIGAVNAAIEEIVPELRDLSENNADAQIKIATLAFSTGANWIGDAPVPAETFRWKYLDAHGVTDLGDACISLNEKLSKKAFMSDATGSFAPVIFLMSDGEPTDDYRHGLERLKQNNWFKKALKVAIAIGEDANEDVLAEFTGTTEAVITVHNPEALKRWIKFVSVRSSEVASNSSNTGEIGGSDTDTLWDSTVNNADNTDDPWFESPIPDKQQEFINALKDEKDKPTEMVDWSNQGEFDNW